MRIKKYIEFIEESYLSGHLQPLYHFTFNLYNVLSEDILKRSKPTRPSKKSQISISLTRNIDYTEADSGVFFELDANLLLIDGYKSYPVDEWALDPFDVGDDEVIGRKRLKTLHLGKSNMDSIKNGYRGTKHNLNLPKDNDLEIEFEERIFKDIKNLGKYIISINMNKDVITNINKAVYNGGDNNLKDYLVKYPHIIIYEYDKNNHRKRKDITEKYK